jgi:hypothetical protein
MCRGSKFGCADRFENLHLLPVLMGRHHLLAHSITLLTFSRSLPLAYQALTSALCTQRVYVTITTPVRGILTAQKIQNCDDTSRWSLFGVVLKKEDMLKILCNHLSA